MAGFHSTYTAQSVAIDRFRQIKWRTDMCASLASDIRAAGMIAEQSILIMERMEEERTQRMARAFQKMGYRL